MEKNLKNKKGITLVALVVTIVVLLILAGVSINLAIGDNGIIRKAQKEKNTIQKDIEQAETRKNKLLNAMKEEKESEGETIKPSPPESQEHAQVGEEVKGSNKPFIDSKGNIAIIPEGFKVLPGCSDISKGLVIEDRELNQYVWIPVGSVKKSSTETVDIQLGRYTFDRNNGNPTLVQPASEFEAQDAKKQIDNSYNSWYYHLEKITGTEGNTKAKDLAGFITSVKQNGGYYIGRYEAGCESVRNSESDSIEGKKLLEQQGKPVYNYVTQPQAATLCQNLYTTVNSDLMNSYAWDTAIDYIQKMGNNNYANKNDGKGGGPRKTGSIVGTDTIAKQDVACNIYDMAANVIEFTTETSIYKESVAERFYYLQ